jgi:hypothetical protein
MVNLAKILQYLFWHWYAYSNPVQIVEGESQFSDDSGLDAYTTMRF